MSNQELERRFDGMSNEEKLLVGAELVKSKQWLELIKDNLLEWEGLEDEHDSENAQELGVVEVMIDISNYDWPTSAVGVQSGEFYTEGMSAAALSRCHRYRDFLVTLVDERIAEIDQFLAQV